MSANTNTQAVLLTRKQVENLLERNPECMTKQGNSAMVAEAERVARRAAQARTRKAKVEEIMALVSTPHTAYSVGPVTSRVALSNEVAALFADFARITERLYGNQA